MKTIKYLSLTRILSALALAASTWPGSAATLYVSLQSTNAVSPYDDWSRAATNIQDAVDIASAGDEVVVSNGVYQVGGRVVSGAMTNRVAVTNAITVRSVNGPTLTTIEGQQEPDTINGDSAVRCVYLADGAVLAGFTLANGATRAAGDIFMEQSGGGAWCTSPSAVVSNCVIVGNSASEYGGGSYDGTLKNCTVVANSGPFGGGAYLGTLSDCTLTNNSASQDGGGALSATLTHCTLTGNWASFGGGAYWGTLINCTLSGNSAYVGGGGTAWATLTNCVLQGNMANWYSGGGGAYGGTLANCVVTNNWSQYAGGGAANAGLRNCYVTGNQARSGGGVTGCTLTNCTLTGNAAQECSGALSSTLYNCIIYFNAPSVYGNYEGGTLNYCCTTPLATGTGNITNVPEFTIGPHLSVTSRCRNSGSSAYAKGTDIDGEAWLPTPAIGCDEYRPGEVTGPLSVTAQASYTNVFVGYSVTLMGSIQGRISYLAWDFGDGTGVTNLQAVTHAWATPGNYAAVFTAFNDSYPAGVSATQTVHVFSQPMMHYVNVLSGAPAAPYTNWASAARTIQDAVEAASMPGAWILVTNGVYQTGGKPFSDPQTNRVAVDKPLRIQSVNGPQLTLIQGEPAIRCVSLADGAVLSGFTLTNGAAAEYGGAAWCQSANSVITNCTLTGSTATYGGGGAYSGTLNNCTLIGNSAGGGGGAYFGTLNNCALINNLAWGEAGGAYSSTLRNCAVTGNSARFAGGTEYCTLNSCTLSGNLASYVGGALSGTLNNCIVYYNSGGNYDWATINYCCTTPLPGSGSGNISQNPELADAWHLSAGSPCHAAGDPASASGTDIDGEPWASVPSIGCDEYVAGAVTGPLSLAVSADYTNVLPGFAVNVAGSVNGHAAACAWDFGDGTVVSNRPWASHAWTKAGDYPVVFLAYNVSQIGGVSATQTVHVFAQPMVHYVAAGSVAPVAPYTSWASAARSIQEAVDAVSMPGAVILVTNGVYQTGGKSISGATTNRVAVDKAVRVQSVNGPQFTIIQGYQVPGTTNGDAAIRCVYLAQGTCLSGFTLTNGANTGNEESSDGSGGGVYCESVGAVVTNCTLTSNSAGVGGGAYSGTLINCKLAGNVASYPGGGAYQSTLVNCTVTDNSASFGGGACYATLVNCIAYYNTAPSHSDCYGCSMDFCCSTQFPDSGTGNITNAPLFVDQAGGNLRLQPGSPCINAGNNSYVTGSTDLDGNPRIVSGTVDMGAYEYQGTGSLISYAWLQQYGLPTDGSADHTDADSDGMDNWQEWMAGTDPTDAASLLRLVPPAVTPPGVLLRWNSDASHAYFIERVTGLGTTPAFSLLQTNIPGQASTTTFTDTTAPRHGAAFYRVGAGSGGASTSFSLVVPQFVPANVTVTWTSVTNRSYSVERSTSLSPPMHFTPVATNVLGQAGTTSVIDTNASGPGPFFYRVGVQ